MICEHLAPLERELIENRIQETYRGAAWGESTREWVYFNCVLDTSSLRTRFHFPEFITVHENTDPRSGTERGFVCNQCLDGIMGKLPIENPDMKPYQ